MILFFFAWLLLRYEAHGFVPAQRRGRKSPITQCYLENSDTNTPRYRVTSYLEALNQIGVASVDSSSSYSSAARSLGDPSVAAAADDDYSHRSSKSRHHNAFSSNYLDAISSSTRSLSGAGPSGYLDEISSLASTGSMDDDATSGHGHSLLGLTDDGDFTMLGINCEEPVSVSEDASSSEQSIRGGRVPYSGVGSFLEGLVSNDLLRSRSATLATTTSATPPSSSIENQKVHPSEETDSQEHQRMKSWLLGLIPTLNEAALAKYAKGLVGIGFDPDCVTCCELRLSDLQFMKVLHRRFFFNEIAGLGHPLKP